MEAKLSLLPSYSYILDLVTFLFHWFQSARTVLTVYPTDDVFACVEKQILNRALQKPVKVPSEIFSHLMVFGFFYTVTDEMQLN